VAPYLLVGRVWVTAEILPTAQPPFSMGHELPVVLGSRSRARSETGPRVTAVGAAGRSTRARAGASAAKCAFRRALERGSKSTWRTRRLPSSHGAPGSVGRFRRRSTANDRGSPRSPRIPAPARPSVPRGPRAIVRRARKADAGDLGRSLATNGPERAHRYALGDEARVPARHRRGGHGEDRRATARRVLQPLPPWFDGERSTPATLAANCCSDASIRTPNPRREAAGHRAAPPEGQRGRARAPRPRAACALNLSHHRRSGRGEARQAPARRRVRRRSDGVRATPPRSPRTPAPARPSVPRTHAVPCGAAVRPSRARSGAASGCPTFGTG
jgi:hypothetical protein